MIAMESLQVYRGTFSNGQLVAVKRAQQGSMQGGLEFKTEIELLSRVHHKNLVSLVGFCFDQGEQMLIYEYIPNGSLKESLSGISNFVYLFIIYTVRSLMNLQTDCFLQFKSSMYCQKYQQSDMKIDS